VNRVNLNRVSLKLNMRRSRRQTKVRVGEDRVNRSCQEEAAREQGAQTLHFALRASHTQLTAKGTMELNTQRKGQRREPAAGGVRFVSERIGWLPFAAPPGSERVLASGNLPYICS
jgi:hypothetical protein